MLQRYLFLILVSFLLSACTHHHTSTSSLPVQTKSYSVYQKRALQPFSQVDVQGRINIHLHTGYKKPEVILTGDARDLAQVKTELNGTTLYIQIGNSYPRYGAVNAEVRGMVLNRFSYKGVGTIKGYKLHTRFLELYLDNQGTTELSGLIGLQILQVSGNGLTSISGINSQDLRVRLMGNPKVKLNGYVSLAKLNVEDGGWLSLYWVRGNHLTVTAKKTARIQLAGAVNRLEVELSGQAQFKGRYLRAQRSFVRTHDRSVAEISSVNHQSDLATDASDIYYFNIPNTRADFMAYKGSVLDMRPWSEDDLEEFTRYNKQFP